MKAVYAYVTPVTLSQCEMATAKLSTLLFQVTLKEGAVVNSTTGTAPAANVLGSIVRVYQSVGHPDSKKSGTDTGLSIAVGATIWSDTFGTLEWTQPLLKGTSMLRIVHKALVKEFFLNFLM